MLVVRSVALAVVAFFILAFFYLNAPYLYDADSYLHLAVARLYAEEGLINALPWARFSVMHEAYGDKELLFHLALIPFVTAGDAAVGGRIALAVLGALIIAVFGALASRRIGWMGLLIPVWLLIAAPPWLNRLMRLRPELLALLLLLVAAELMVRRRNIWLAVTAALFALSYTAFHVFGGLVAIWTAVIGLATRRWDWPPLAYAIAGTSAGLVLHPYPVDHLRIWALQNITFFQMKNRLDVGEEIFAPPWQEALFVNAGWAIVLIALIAIAGWKRRDLLRTREALIYGTTALVFLVLYLAMARMIIYLVPFVALAAAVMAAGIEWRPRMRLIIGAMAAAAMIPGIIFSLRIDFVSATLAGRTMRTEADLEQLGKAVPRGAKVAATWSDAQLLSFWAPQGRYLNLYDPLFMAVAHPRAYEAQRALFQGAVIDIPPTLTSVLDSDHLALQSPTSFRRLLHVLDGDPRWRVVHGGGSLLLQLREPRSGGFLLDWEVSETGAEPVPYPYRKGSGEAFVSLGRVAPAGSCRTFVAPDPCSGCMLRFRAIGAARLIVDGMVAATHQDARELSGWKPLAAAPRQSLVVELCGPAHAGFFLFATQN